MHCEIGRVHHLKREMLKHEIACVWMIKNLSENQDFGKDQLSTGKVKESEVILLFFLESVPGADAND